MRSSDWSSDVCSSDRSVIGYQLGVGRVPARDANCFLRRGLPVAHQRPRRRSQIGRVQERMTRNQGFIAPIVDETSDRVVDTNRLEHADTSLVTRSEEHTSEIQVIMRNSYTIFSLK